jgi:hypothetical protein
VEKEKGGGGPVCLCVCEWEGIFFKCRCVIALCLVYDSGQPHSKGLKHTHTRHKAKNASTCRGHRSKRKAEGKPMYV